MDLSKYITNKLMSIISRRSDGISEGGEGGVAFFLIRFGRDRRSFSIDSLHLYQSLSFIPSLLRNSSLHALFSICKVKFRDVNADASRQIFCRVCR